MSESQYGKLFIRREILEQQLVIHNEETLGEYKEIQYEDASQKKEIKVTHLDLKITSHRIIFTSKNNNWLAFCMNIETIKDIKSKKGWFGNAIKHINIYTFDNTKIRLVAPDPQLVRPLQNIQDAMNKKLWTIKAPPPKPKVQNDPERVYIAEAKSGMYVGTKQIVNQKKQEINSQENKFQSSFGGGDIKALMQHSSELKELIEYIKVNSQVYKEQNNSEVDQLLEGIGCFDAVTKEDAGKDYINKLSQQIYNEICINLFNMYGGIIPLLDVYYFYNKRRGGLNYISATEVYQACQNFQNIGIKAKISIYENNKVIESTEFDIEKDFEQDIGKYIGKDGISAEQLSKKLTEEKVTQNNKSGTVSVMIARIRLNRALKAGKIVLDDRIEGAKYYRNYILQGF